MSVHSNRIALFIDGINLFATAKSLGYLSGSSVGFVEDFTGITSCSQIPATSAYFGGGIGGTADSGSVRGTIKAPYAVGVCQGKVQFSHQIHDDGGMTIIQEKGID